MISPYFKKFRCKKEDKWIDSKNNDLSEIEPLLTKILRIYEKQNAKNIIIRYLGSEEEIENRNFESMLSLHEIKDNTITYRLTHHYKKLPVSLVLSYFDKIPNYLLINHIMVL